MSLQKLESVLTEVSWLMFMLDSGLEMVVDIEVLDLDLELDRESEGEESGSGPWSEKYGCASAWRAVILCFGSKWSIFCKSMNHESELNLKFVMRN